MEFNELVKFFEGLGYPMLVTGDTAESHSDLVIKFEPYDSNKPQTSTNGRIAVDSPNCFYSWARCPVNLPFPKDDREKQILVDALAWLKTPEGEKASNEYDYEQWIRVY